MVYTRVLSGSRLPSRRLATRRLHNGDADIGKDIRQARVFLRQLSPDRPHSITSFHPQIKTLSPSESINADPRVPWAGYYEAI